MNYEWKPGDPSPVSVWTIGAALDEIAKLRAALTACEELADMCRSELQGRLSDDAHQRAFRVLGQIREMARNAR